MIGALGAEIDRLEYEIQQAVPGIRHIDLVSRTAQSPRQLIVITHSEDSSWCKDGVAQGG